MPKGKIMYPKYMTVTDEGKALISIWRRINKNTDPYGPFSGYPGFYNWAMDHYFWLGARLHRYDDTKEYSPDNCYFTPANDEPRTLTKDQRVLANKWNRTVNVFRRACGLKLFDVYDEEDFLGDGVL